MLSLSHTQNVETGFRAFLSLTFLFELVFFEKRGGLRWGAAVKSSGGAECEAVTLEDKPGRTSAHRQLTGELDSLQMETVEALFHLETQLPIEFVWVFPAIVAGAETQSRHSKIIFLRAGKKSFSKDMTYSYFGNGKKKCMV